jgi:hypothetical protein
MCDRKAGRFIVKAIRENSPYRGIIEFNDAGETTFVDVRRVLFRSRELAASGPIFCKSLKRSSKDRRIKDHRQLTLPSVYA